MEVFYLFRNNIHYFMVNDYFKASSITFSIFHAFSSKVEQFIFNLSLVYLDEMAFQEKKHIQIDIHVGTIKVVEKSLACLSRLSRPLSATYAVLFLSISVHERPLPKAL
jgi:hypothetical protein